MSEGDRKYYQMFERPTDEETISAFDVVLVALSLLCFLVHLTGSFTLIQLQRKAQKRKTQRLYIINLSILECFKGLLNSIVILLTKSLPKYSHSHAHVETKIQHQLAIISEVPVAFLYYTAIIYLTLDRLLATKLELSYDIHVNFRRVKWLLILTWFFSGLLGITVALFHGYFDFYYSPYNLFIYLAFDVIFFVLAISTYVTIYDKYKNSMTFQIKRVINGRRISVVAMFRKSSFYIPILLITIFLFLMVIPDFIHVVSIIAKRPPSAVITHCYMVLYVVSDISDACIYILLQKKVRQYLYSKIKCRKRGFRRRLRRQSDPDQSPQQLLRRNNRMSFEMMSMYKRKNSLVSINSDCRSMKDFRKDQFCVN